MENHTSDTKTWPELAIGLYDKLTGRGADATPYFRIFNPMTQGQKFDPAGVYVRRWIPELAKAPARWIHKPWDAPQTVLSEAGVTLGQTYPFPIIDHRVARERALAAFASLRNHVSTRP